MNQSMISPIQQYFVDEFLHTIDAIVSNQTMDSIDDSKYMI